MKLFTVLSTVLLFSGCSLLKSDMTFPQLKNEIKFSTTTALILSSEDEDEIAVNANIVKNFINHCIEKLDQASDSQVILSLQDTNDLFRDFAEELSPRRRVAFLLIADLIRTNIVVPNIDLDVDFSIPLEVKALRLRVLTLLRGVEEGANEVLSLFSEEDVDV